LNCRYYPSMKEAVELGPICACGSEISASACSRDDENACPYAAEAKKREMKEGLLKIGELLRTQYNRITDQPMFIVQQKIRDYGYDSNHCDDYDWLDLYSGDYNRADERETRILDKMHERYRKIDGWEQVYYRDRWEFVTACFTEQGCKDYLAINKHNLKETRIYADGSYRNHEYQLVRNFLMSLKEEKDGENNSTGF